MEYLGIIIVLIATGIALATDLKYRKIYNKLTFPLFLSGLIFSLLNLLITPNVYLVIGRGFFFSLGAFLKAWLGPPLIIFAYGIFVFLLKILGAGDCKFLVALTPWLGLSKMVKIILYFYPLALVYMILYYFHQERYNFKKIAKEQWQELILNIKAFSKIFRKEKNKEVFVINEQASSESEQKTPPAGMVPISIAVIFAILT